MKTSENGRLFILSNQTTNEPETNIATAENGGCSRLRLTDLSDEVWNSHHWREGTAGGKGTSCVASKSFYQAGTMVFTQAGLCMRLAGRGIIA